jgi:hypothetical protein
MNEWKWENISTSCQLTLLSSKFAANKHYNKYLQQFPKEKKKDLYLDLESLYTEIRKRAIESINNKFTADECQDIMLQLV